MTGVPVTSIVSGQTWKRSIRGVKGVFLSEKRSIRGRTLAVDPGKRRLGVALSDELGLTVRPLLTLDRKIDKDVVARLVDLVVKYQIGFVVVGLPVRPSGDRGPEAVAALALAESLRQSLLTRGLSIEVESVDESYTTTEAEVRLRERGLGPDERRKVIDQEAAAVLLEDYLRSLPSSPRGEES